MKKLLLCLLILPLRLHAADTTLTAAESAQLDLATTESQKAVDMIAARANANAAAVAENATLKAQVAALQAQVTQLQQQLVAAQTALTKSQADLKVAQVRIDGATKALTGTVP